MSAQGGRAGSGIATDQDVAANRKERLRQLALERIDISKDPYIFRNHIGSYECKLCMTLHRDEGNYLAHTQGKRHQTNLARRAQREKFNSLEKGSQFLTTPSQQASYLMHQNQPKVPQRKLKIGIPGYQVTKMKDVETEQKILLFVIDYPEIAEGVQPRFRIVSTWEQKVEPKDENYQYLLVAAEPYETVAFKIPNKPIETDMKEGKLKVTWEPPKYTIQLRFIE